MSAPRHGLAARLLLAQSFVLVSGALSTWLVASAIGPSIFHTHLRRAGVVHTDTENAHIEEAFASALLISIGVALLAATVAALGVTWYLTRRMQRSIGQVADAAAQIATGHYGSRVTDPGIGAEFATLADGYNTLAERLEATETMRRRLLADLAHEMRNPLATVDAHLEAVEDGVRPLDAETLAVIRGSTRRLRRLAEDVAAVSSAEEGVLGQNHHRVPAADLARHAAAAAQERYAARGVTLRTRLETDDLVDVDADRTGQVLANLLDNALRHAGDDGTVTLTCRAARPWVEITVEDTGTGIEPEHLPHVFDRFYRVDTARDRGSGGSGIGLAIAKALVESHGGRITAHSAGPGRGAMFVVRLPAAHG
ncbi:MAG TPA: HAMP domain-containing sensor histidine kinase [Nocardioides sp.]|nr:HAMP domain-containing sensor histidine kinase [Nocardioides sp.]